MDKSQCYGQPTSSLGGQAMDDYGLAAFAARVAHSLTHRVAHIPKRDLPTPKA